MHVPRPSVINEPGCVLERAHLRTETSEVGRGKQLVSGDFRNQSTVEKSSPGIDDDRL